MTPVNQFLILLAIASFLPACTERTIEEFWSEEVSLEEHCQAYCDLQVECDNSNYTMVPCFELCVDHQELRGWESEACYLIQREQQGCLVARGCAGWDDPVGRELFDSDNICKPKPEGYEDG